MEIKCTKHLTKDEIFRIIEEAKFACLTIFGREDMRSIPVCFELRRCNENLIFEVRAKEDERDLECLKDCDKVLLEFERRDKNDCKDHEKTIETVFVIGAVVKNECDFEKLKWASCDKLNVVEICVLEIFGRSYRMECPKFKCELVCEEREKEKEHECERKCEPRKEDKCELNRSGDKGCKGGNCNR